jgi:low affinity Fe/Cu permease
MPDKESSNSPVRTFWSAIDHGFNQFAKWGARFTGRPAAFCLAVLIVAVWAVTGPIFHYSDTWQLVINTGTTIVTFLMVFLIQNTQNRDIAATQIKLDELIRALEGAHNGLLDLEQLDEEQLETLRQKYERLAAEARLELQRGRVDTDSRELASKTEITDPRAARRKSKQPPPRRGSSRRAPRERS